MSAPSETALAAPPAPPTLRAAHKELTRSRIRDAARELFYQQGFSITTMDQIASAAGVRRSTLYFHYRDKDEIVRRIVEDYAPKSKAVMQRLPAPRPTRAEIAAWMHEVIDLVRAERAPTVLFRELTGAPTSPGSDMWNLGQELIESMAERLPAFRPALEPGPAQAVARARTELVLRELTHACLYASRADADERACALLTVAGDLLFNFTEGSADLIG